MCERRVLNCYINIALSALACAQSAAGRSVGMKLQKQHEGTEQLRLTRQKRAAGTVMGCLVLLLLYGCASSGKALPAVTVLSDRADAQENGAQQTDGASEDEAAADTRIDAGSSAPVSQGVQTIAVFVCGAVARPGVYELPEGSRVYEAVALAGGLSQEASQTAVNQAELLADGQMIRIPTEEEQQSGAADEAAHADGLVNINTADLEELKTLPGIGDSKARSIIAYREQNGAFGAVEDIKNIEGIKDGVFAKLKGCIKVD